MVVGCVWGEVGGGIGNGSNVRCGGMWDYVEE